MKARKEKTRHDPFEVVLCAVFGASMLLQCVYGPPPDSVFAAMPPGFRTLWLVLMLIGCTTTLVGLFARRVWGYLIEQVGLGALGWSLVAFGAQLLLLQLQHGTFGPPTVLGGPLPMALGLAFLWKRRQVLQDVRILRAVKLREAS
ncbi:hypothetical protein [Nocardia beijingensis]